jgi:hypothetical protein
MRLVSHGAIQYMPLLMKLSFDEAFLLLKKWKESAVLIHMLDVTNSTWFTGRIADLSEERLVISDGRPATRFRMLARLQQATFEYEDSRTIEGASQHRYECSLIVSTPDGLRFILSETV